MKSNYVVSDGKWCPFGTPAKMSVKQYLNFLAIMKRKNDEKESVRST